MPTGIIQDGGGCEHALNERVSLTREEEDNAPLR